LLRSWYGASNAYNLKNWKMEYSKDIVNWVIIDKQIERNWITEDWSEVYFPVQTKESFSYLKFTQIGNNYNNCDCFSSIVLNSLKQFWINKYPFC
jgi:hypothetical protein